MLHRLWGLGKQPPTATRTKAHSFQTKFPSLIFSPVFLKREKKPTGQRPLLEVHTGCSFKSPTQMATAASTLASFILAAFLSLKDFVGCFVFLFNSDLENSWAAPFPRKDENLWHPSAGRRKRFVIFRWNQHRPSSGAK